ncbi:MAG TPA: hypothetical protein VFN26_17275 [Candidatus Acidoferrum sp.]|nr:hypothetical protein [Candidatus Acidoferrum sp.]
MVNNAAMYTISYDKPQRLVCLTWLPGTASMTDQDCKGALEAFAESILQHIAQKLIIDMREFKHRPPAEILTWRNDVTVSKYNRAGVRKVAWVWPGMTGGTSTSEGDKFENHYCSTEAEALAWVMTLERK